MSDIKAFIENDFFPKITEEEKHDFIEGDTPGLNKLLDLLQEENPENSMCRKTYTEEIDNIRKELYYKEIFGDSVRDECANDWGKICEIVWKYFGRTNNLFDTGLTVQYISMKSSIEDNKDLIKSAAHYGLIKSSFEDIIVNNYISLDRRPSDITVKEVLRQLIMYYFSLEDLQKLFSEAG